MKKQVENEKLRLIVFESANEIINEHSNGKVIYLTFDDGPGSHTERLLDILDKYNVKVIGASADAINKAEDRGEFKKIVSSLGLESAE